ncbi:MAG: class I SAM-dependent methyltransferase [Croceitalea sp.]|nr:class I SAM-dependent methyltransferase [Croceitalea sp.]
MNKSILNTGVQLFIKNNWNTDIMSVLLKKPLFKQVSQKELAEQLEAKKKCKDKLPLWFNTPKIYYPNKLHIEQTSSEITADYKAKIVGGKTLLDLTGGLGVDTYFFSKIVDHIWHCEINPELSKIAAHNLAILGCANITFVQNDGVEFIKSNLAAYDWIYVDPSRRSDAKGKVFLLEDCLPNMTKNLQLLFHSTKNVLIKTSPLMDISKGIDELEAVKEIHVVAVANEVKELLWVLEKGFEGDIKIKTVNLLPGQSQVFEFWRDEESSAISEYGVPNKYLYEPNAAIMKSGGFKSVGNYFGVDKLNEHSHLYTSSQLTAFPGRRFIIEEIVPYRKKELQKLGISKANITTRNFPLTVVTLRKKLKIKDGGDDYLFFTKGLDDQLLVIRCRKA